MNAGKTSAFLLLLGGFLLYSFFPAFSRYAAGGPASYPVVKFNGVAAEVLSSSDSEVKARVPLGASTGPISVETEGGTVQFSEEDFEVESQSPAPTGVTAKASVENIEISWSPPIAEDLTGYNIYRSASENGTYAQIKSGVTETFYLDESKDLASGETYFYKVGAVYAKGKESGQSEAASAVFGTISLWIPNVNGAQEKKDSKALSSKSNLLVPVNVENADKLTMGEVELYIDYDASFLKPSSVEKTILSVEYDWQIAVASPGTVKIYIKQAVNKPLRGVGALFNIVFEVLDAAKEGQTVNFAFHDKNHSLPSFIKSPEGREIPLNLSNGALTIQLQYRKGDVNGDAKVRSNDSSSAFVYAAGIIEPAAGPLAGGDIDGDKSIMTNDSGLILYYVVNNGWPSLENIDVYQKERTVDMGTKTLVSKLSSHWSLVNGQLEQGAGDRGQGEENEGRKTKDGNNLSIVNRQSSIVNRQFLEVPLYISTLNDMNSGEFGVVYPLSILKAVKFTPDKGIKKLFDARTEFRRNGLAVVSLVYKKKGRASAGFKRTAFGTLKFEVLANKTAKGEVGFSSINLYDRFGRDFVRSDLNMSIVKKGAKFTIKAGTGKAFDAASLASTVTFSPKKGNVGDVITIQGNFAADTTAPKNTTSTNFINGGASSTTSANVTLSLSATDDAGVTGYYASETPTTPAAGASGWEPVASEASYSASVSFTLSSGQGVKTVYVWFRDAAGNVSPAASGSINFKTGGGGATAPNVSSVSPALGATGVGTNTAVTATFSKTMDPKTITAATFTVSGGVTGSVAYSGVTAKFKPSAPLSPNTTYTATITTGVKDTAGNAMASSYLWSFKTGAGADSTAPAVSSVSPANGATGVPSGGASGIITIIFSEAMDPTSITTSTITSSPGPGMSINYSGTTATLTPTTGFFANTVYTITVTTGVRDSAGNPLPNSYSWNFKTAGGGDTTAPNVSSVSPALGAAGVGTNTSITATFSESMDSATITASTFTISGGVTGSVAYSGKTATFTPSSNLSPNTTYTATITTGVKDAAGNAMASSYSWSFTTAGGTDTTAPTVSSVSPASGATGVPSGSSSGIITIIFSEAMDPASITTSTITSSPGPGMSINYSGTTATLTPTTGFFAGTTYTITVTTGVKDSAGNAMASSYSWSFTTAGGGDTTAPNVNSVSPALGATGVGTNTSITATFSETMDSSTITTSTFTVSGGVTGSVAYSGATATFTPSSNLSPNTTYTATITTGVKDAAGNAMASSYAWSFTTSATSDAIPPTVSSVSPANGATGVPSGGASGIITIIFSEAMDPASITTSTITSSPGPGMSINYSGTTATLTPTTGFFANTAYTITVTTGVKDLAGNAMASSYAWSFTTGP
ncbi:MAG: Ig-like domain-containing protein [Nitrospinae bacterium]|nr:Ig-like domain-containing protein [Nitrospinota bacterium]